MAEFPNEWVRCKVSDFSHIVMGQSPPSRTYNKGGIGLPFYQGKAEFGDLYPEPVKYCKAPKKIAEKGATLLSVRAPVGPTNIAPHRACIGRGLAGIHPLGGMQDRFILYLFRNYEPVLSGQGKGTTFKAITKDFLFDLNFTLPPLPEQIYILGTIEELFSDLDNAVENLKKAHEQLKIYRQAVLKWAFEGKLTNRNVLEAVLPPGWKRVALKTITTKAEKVNLKDKKTTDEFLYIDIGGIDNSINRIATHKIYQWKDAPSRAQQIVKFEDTLFSTVRTYLRNIALVDKLIYEDQICSSGFTVIRAKYDEVVPKYLFYYSIFEGFIQALNELQTGTSYPAVRDDDVLNQYINIPTELEEQQAIVAEIESRLSVCGQLEESINDNLQKAEALRQSILKQAFAGKLTEKWRKDHPDLISGENSAEALLKKIKADKEILKVTPKGKKEA